MNSHTEEANASKKPSRIFLILNQFLGGWDEVDDDDDDDDEEEEEVESHSPAT